MMLPASRSSSRLPRLALSLLLVAFLGAPVPARAQAPDQEDPRTTARMNVGPFYLTPTIALTNLGVDTNVFNQVENPKSDFTFTVEPHVDVWLPFVRRAMLSAYVTPGLTWYQTFSGERSFNPEAGGRFEAYFNRITLFAGGSYLNTRQRPNFEIDVRARRKEDAADVGAEVRVFRKLSFETGAHQTRIRFDADALFDGTSLQKVLNRNERSASVAVKWRYSALTTVVVRTEVIRDRFQLSPERNSNSSRTMVGADFRPRALLSGTAYIGYRRFKGLNPSLPDFSGVVAQAGISYTLAGLTTVGLTADRDVSYSYEPTLPYYVRDGYGLSIRQYLGWRLDGIIGATRYQYTYRSLLLGPASGPAQAGSLLTALERQDVTWTYSASIGYRVGRDGRIGLGATYWDRRSNTLVNRDYTGLRAGLLVEYGTR